MKRNLTALILIAFALNSHALISRLHKRNYEARINAVSEQDARPQPERSAQQQPWYQRVFPRREARPSHLGEDFATEQPQDTTRMAELESTRPQLNIDREQAMQAERPTERPSREDDAAELAALAPSLPAPEAPVPAQVPVTKPVTKISHVYSIQLIGSGDRQQIKKFLAQHGYQHKATILSERRGGRMWYSAVVGQYANKEEARRNIARLPRSLRVNRPWIKSREVRHVVRAAAPQRHARAAQPARRAPKPDRYARLEQRHIASSDRQYHGSAPQGAFSDDDGYMEIHVTS